MFFFLFFFCFFFFCFFLLFFCSTRSCHISTFSFAKLTAISFYNNMIRDKKLYNANIQLFSVHIPNEFPFCFRATQISDFTSTISYTERKVWSKSRSCNTILYSNKGKHRPKPREQAIDLWNVSRLVILYIRSRSGLHIYLWIRLTLHLKQFYHTMYGWNKDKLTGKQFLFIPTIISFS